MDRNELIKALWQFREKVIECEELEDVARLKTVVDIEDAIERLEENGEE